MPRHPLLAANWKMFPTPKNFGAKDSPYRSTGGVDIVVFPSFLDIQACIEVKIATGGQYGRPEREGAFTGDISMFFLKEMGCSYALCGHSERRRYHGETDEFIGQQVAAALEAGLHPIVCMGETAEERKKGEEKDAVKRHLKAIPFGQDPAHIGVSIAYEPVWAIGTGVAATPEDAQTMHAFIRSLLPKDVRETTLILYGGSVNDLNAADFLKQEDVDGLLVGGASLKPESFAQIRASAIEQAGQEQ